ncbi:hypothetical protein [Photobacterium damselae]|uniref:hypothetical protein n=1 Tax=Photobacterium damselae TaxID=38293 RepID=UPI0040690B61
MKYANFSIDSCVAQGINNVVSEYLNKGDTKYYQDLRQKWDNYPVRTVRDGLSVPSTNKVWRIFLSRCIRKAMKIARNSGDWRVSDDDYNKKLEALVHFVNYGSFVVKQAVCNSTRDNNKKRGASTQDKNKDKLEYLVPLIEDEVHRQIGIATTLYPEIDAELFKNEMVIKFSFANGVSSSSAGVKNGKVFFKFALSEFLKFDLKKTWAWNENPSFSKDEHIGSVKNCMLSEYVTLLVAHNTSHVVQFWLANALENNNLSAWGGFVHSELIETHGEAWKSIYGKLREKVFTELPALTTSD